MSIDKKKLDELLSAYLDEELSPRKQTEVKRLLKHDENVLRRFNELKSCRDLIAALPEEQPPGDILSQVQEKLDQRSLIEICNSDFDRTKGVKYFRIKKSISIAAMLVLVGVLAMIVYSIMVSGPGKKNLAGTWDQEIEIKPVTSEPVKIKVVSNENVDTKPVIKEKKKLSGGLELMTVSSNFKGVDAFIKRAMVDSKIMIVEFPVNDSEQGFYTVKCSKESMSMFLADMSGIWDKFDSSVLKVRLENDNEIVVNDVTALQINAVMIESDSEIAMSKAREYATLNDLSQFSPKRMFTNAGKPNINEIPIPKPNLTGNGPAVDPNNNSEDIDLVELIIILRTSE